MNPHLFKYSDYDVQAEPLRSEIIADRDRLLASSATRTSLSGRERDDKQMIKDLIRGKVAEYQHQKH